MSSESLSRFTTSLGRLGVEWTRTPPVSVSSVVESLLREPAIGVDPQLDGVSLPPVVDTDPTPKSLYAAETGVTTASMGIAAYGSVVLEADAAGSEQVSLFPALHIAILRRSDIVGGMPAAIDRLAPALRNEGSAIIATGPSATADMGALVRGAHGPRDVHVVIVDEDAPEPDTTGAPEETEGTTGGDDA
ncbi:LUD domain-containing protein [Haloferacaceae archaeon DSL9]